MKAESTLPALALTREDTQEAELSTGVNPAAFLTESDRFDKNPALWHTADQPILVSIGVTVSEHERNGAPLPNACAFRQAHLSVCFAFTGHRSSISMTTIFSVPEGCQWDTK